MNKIISVIVSTLIAISVVAAAFADDKRVENPAQKAAKARTKADQKYLKAKAKTDARNADAKAAKETIEEDIKAAKELENNLK